MNSQIVFRFTFCLAILFFPKVPTRGAPMVVDLATDACKPGRGVLEIDLGDRGHGSPAAFIGDINGDGYDDFAVGAETNDEAGMDAGKVYIWHGGKQLDSLAAFTLLSEKNSEHFGTALASGKDINADGVGDLLVGASYGGSKFTGAVYIYLGTEFSSPAKILEGNETGDLFGSSITMLGDINNDGVSEFLVGAYYASVNGKTAAGKAYLYEGGSIISSEPEFVLKGEHKGGWFGFALAPISKFSPEVAFGVGIPRGGVNGGGEIILFNRDSKPSFKITNSKTIGRLGYSFCELGDLNRDGFNEIIAGLPYATSSGFHSGMARVYYGGEQPDNKSDMNFPGDVTDGQFGASVCYIDKFLGKDKGIIVIGAPGIGRAGYIEVYK